VERNIGSVVGGAVPGEGKYGRSAEEKGRNVLAKPDNCGVAILTRGRPTVGRRRRATRSALTIAARSHRRDGDGFGCGWTFTRLRPMAVAARCADHGLDEIRRRFDDLRLKSLGFAGCGDLNRTRMQATAAAAADRQAAGGFAGRGLGR
jgi:hypothetical protein